MANQSGWSNEGLFLQYLEHFIKIVKPSRDDGVLLIMDNHKSHLSIEATKLAKDYGITILTFPPHTSHKLQPLDRTVFGPFKTYKDQASKEWMHTNPGRPITIYDMAALVGKAFPRAFTPENITKGFEVTGIWFKNSQIFREDEFLSAEMSNRPYEVEAPTTASQVVPGLPSGEASIQTQEDTGIPSPSFTENFIQTPVTPEDLRPFPKAPPRKGLKRGRPTGKCRIATDTPEKQEIEEGKMRRKPVKKALALSSSEEEVLELADSSAGSDFIGLSSSEDEDLSDFLEGQGGSSLLCPNQSWILVEYSLPKGAVYYVGQVQAGRPRSSEVSVKFLRKRRNAFVFPNVDDITAVDLKDVKKVLPEPRVRRGQHFFNVKFPLNLNIR